MKVLLVKMSSLGDVVHALPAVTDAARRGVRFHWVVEEAFQAVPAAHPAVEKVLPIAWRRWRRRLWRSRDEMKSFYESLAGERYDVAIDSQGLVKSALTMKGARARERVGFCGDFAREPVAARFYDRCVEVSWGGHAVDRQRRLFKGALNHEYDAAEVDFGLGQKDMGLVLGPEDVDPVPERSGVGPAPGREDISRVPGRESAAGRCVFLHGATWATKLWPEAMWAELARVAGEAGLEVVLPWGNGEDRARAERIAGASGAALLPALNLGELMEELRRARLAVGVDSGLVHLAGALGVPSVVLYGSTSSALTGCRGSRVRNLQAEFACSPCLSRTCRYRGSQVRWRETAVTPPCYGELHPDRVWAAALETMDADRLLYI